MSPGSFDAAAEREYYRNPPNLLRDFRFLDPIYRNFLGDVRLYFHRKRVLDIGAGECLHGMFVCSVCEPTLYLNLDMFPDRMAIAANVAHPSTMSFAVGDALHLPVRTESVDVVWTSFVLFRLRPLDAIVAEVARVLAPGGQFIGVESNFWNPLVLLRILMRRPGHPYWNANDGYLSPRKVRTAFRRQKFDVKLRFFWRKLPWLHHPILSPTLGIVARKTQGRAA